MATRKPLDPLAGIEALAPQLLRMIEGRGAKVRKAVARTGEPAASFKPLLTKTYAQVRGRLDTAHYFVEKCIHDVPRLNSGLRPSPAQEAKIRGKLLSLIDRCGDFRALFSGGRTPHRG